MAKDLVDVVISRIEIILLKNNPQLDESDRQELIQSYREAGKKYVSLARGRAVNPELLQAWLLELGKRQPTWNDLVKVIKIDDPRFDQ